MDNSNWLTGPKVRMWRNGLVLIWLTQFMTPLPADAANATSELCSSAARQASRETGVPLPVLLAITMAETGRNLDGQFQPWPWTVNSQGIGKWFDTPAEAQAFASHERANGKSSFDVGCFQLNYKWHGTAFRSIDHMFEPGANARYAADFLSDLYSETGNWPDAAAFYHSRTPKYASKYRDRFTRILARVGGSTLSASEPPAEPTATTSPIRIRENNFPLLLAGQTGTATHGSLFPVQPRSNRPFFGHR